jgi:transposase-like protein
MQCPRCLNKKIVKSGFIKEKQRFKCSDCGYNFTVNKLGKQIDPYFIVKALQLYLEGLSYREIERIIGVNNVTIANWVKHFGVKKPFNKKQKPNYKILNSNQLETYFKENTATANQAFLITPIGDKFMLIQWNRFSPDE